MSTQDFDYKEDGQRHLKKALDLELNHGIAKNVIVFLGDGMGVSTVTAARWYNRDKKGINAQDSKLSFEEFPHTALAKTYTANAITGGSAATITAILSGVKSQTGTLGVNGKVPKSNCSAIEGNAVKSILRHSIDKGKWTGLVSTTRVTQATPAGAYATIASRYWESSHTPEAIGKEFCPDIATQLMEDDVNSNIRVILGGGRREFLPNTTSDPDNPQLMGRRKDGKDLISYWKDHKRNKLLMDDQYKYVMNKKELDQVDEESVDYLLGLFSYSTMDFEIDRTSKEDITQPSLTEMTEKAIKILQKGEEGYFLLVEGANIDLAHHMTLPMKALDETVAFSDAVAKAVDMTNEEDTLIIVTADHSHVMSIAGDPDIEDNILGTTFFPLGNLDGKPYSILQYTNGAGYMAHRTINNSLEHIIPRKDLTNNMEMISDPNYMADTGLPARLESHAGEDVTVYALGPMSHLFHGVQEQSYIGQALMYASCVGPNLNHCKKEKDVKDKDSSSQCECNSAGQTDKQILFSIIILSFLVIISVNAY